MYDYKVNFETYIVCERLIYWFKFSSYQDSMLIFEEEKRAPLHASDYFAVGSYSIANDKKEYKTFLLLLHQKLEHRVKIP